MKVKLHQSLFAICLLFAAASLQAQSTTTAGFAWLTGQWEIKSPNGTMLESWKVQDDSTLLGSSVFIKGQDTIPQETVVLSYRNKQWNYTVTAANQNNEQPVPFTVIFSQRNEFIAENPGHDFPQRITYRRIDRMIYASIEGKINGKFSKRNFDFTQR